MRLENKTNEDIYQKLANDIIWRLNLVWDKTFDVIYEYIKNNIHNLEEYKRESLSNRITGENGESSDYCCIYKLIQNGSETNCILVSYSYKGSAKFFPIKVDSISKNGTDKSQKLMTFRMEVPENGDRTKTWSFTKQVINCIGAFEEKYEPLKDKIETIFCPLDVYENALCSINNYGLDLGKRSGDRELVSCDDDFITYPIVKYGLNNYTVITATKTDKEGKYIVIIKYGDGKEESERISADSLYGAYIIYMEKHGYYGVEDKVGKHKVYCTENQD